MLIQELCDILERDLRRELQAQDHNATKKLSKSISVSFKELSNGLHIEGKYLHYGQYVDRGRKKGVKAVPISALMKWIKAKNIAYGDKEAKGVAFAIQTKIKKYGIPSKPYSKHYSKGNSLNKTDFTARTLAKNEKNIRDYIQRYFAERIEIEIENLARNTTKKII